MSDKTTGTVYAIRLSQPLGHTERQPGRRFQQARYYIGFTTRPVHVRLKEHVEGYGSKMLAEAARRGYVLEVVKTWPNVPQTFERYLKLYKRNERVIREDIEYEPAKVQAAVARFTARSMARKMAEQEQGWPARPQDDDSEFIPF